MAGFRIPNSIVYGPGSIERLAGLGGKRMLIVTDCHEAAEPLSRLLQRDGRGVRILNVPRGAALSETVQEGVKALMEFRPEWTAALGGRGAVDCAKLMCLSYQYPELSEADLISGKASGLYLDKTGLAAIPLLNTDGAETMARAVLKQGKAESVIFSPALMPSLLIMEDELLHYCPAEEEAAAVLSTLTLALEAAASVNAGSFTLPLAAESLRLITGSVMAYADAPARREEMLMAQTLAGIAHFNSGWGLCSAMIRASSVFGLALSFGQSAAIILPRLLMGRQDPILSDMAARIGLDGGAEAFAALAEEYADMLGLPLTFREAGLDRNAFLKRLSYAARQAAQDVSATALYGDEAQKRIEELYRSCYPIVD